MDAAMLAMVPASQARMAGGTGACCRGVRSSRMACGVHVASPTFVAALAASFAASRATTAIPVVPELTQRTTVRAPRALRQAAPAHVGGPGAYFFLSPLDTGVDASKTLLASRAAGPSLGPGSLALLALLALHRLAEAEAFAIHLEDVTAVRQAVQ